MDPWLEINREMWDRRTPIHISSAFYDVEGFLAGKSSLREIELKELGDVSGKDLLHLQCHFGLDTLSFSRAGARVCGVDFSREAIAEAHALAEKASIEAAFVESNILDLPLVHEAQYDIVFTSYGCVTWMPDLDTWARILFHFLVPGGTFYIVDFHPMLWTLDEEGVLTHRYFQSDEPFIETEKGTYADPSSDVEITSYSWNYPVSEIITALIGAGLKIEHFHEFPFSPYELPGMVPAGPNRWRPNVRERSIPVTYSIRASRPLR